MCEGQARVLAHLEALVARGHAPAAPAPLRVVADAEPSDTEEEDGPLANGQPDGANVRVEEHTRGGALRLRLTAAAEVDGCG